MQGSWKLEVGRYILGDFFNFLKDFAFTSSTSSSHNISFQKVKTVGLSEHVPTSFQPHKCKCSTFEQFKLLWNRWQQIYVSKFQFFPKTPIHFYANCFCTSLPEYSKTNNLNSPIPFSNEQTFCKLPIIFLPHVPTLDSSPSFQQLCPSTVFNCTFSLKLEIM